MLIPGQECYSLEPGYFRLCYTAESLEVVVRGIEKMAAALTNCCPNTPAVAARDRVSTV